LYRYPKLKGEKLQAWNAADTYLIEEFMQQVSEHHWQRCLIVNDQFGTLHCAILHYAKIHNLDLNCLGWTDSYVAQQALNMNLKQNQLANPKLQPLTSMEKPCTNFDVVLMKIPKSLAYLDYQLDCIRSVGSENVPIIAAGMVKDIHRSTLNCFEKVIGKTRTSLARKKARLIFSFLDSKKMNKESNLEPHTKRWNFHYQDIRLQLINDANVYSRNKMDQGAQLLIQTLYQQRDFFDAKSVMDLGCGNSVVGLAYAKLHDDCNITFIDESYMAIHSAQQNSQNNFENCERFNFMVDNCLESFAAETCDLILCNPPFHQQQTLTDHIAWQMIKDAHKVLVNGGKLILVGNRHLNYHVKLKHLFHNVKTLSSHSRFVVLQSIKTA